MIGEALEKLEKGKLKPHEVDKFIWKKDCHEKAGKWQEAANAADYTRLRLIEKKTGTMFQEIQKSNVEIADKNKLTTGIENKIGAAKVPMGFIGPVKIKGDYAKGDFFVPMATNEAALIAGASRGVKAMNESGGTRVIIKRTGMSRAPVLEFGNIDDAAKTASEIENKRALYKKMKKEAEKNSRVSKLVEIIPHQMGRRLYLRFVFDTGDSMGMNSVTKYSADAVKVLMDKYKAKLVTLSGNMCSDKKSTHINVLSGRGKSIETEIIIKRDIIENVFKVSPEAIVKLNWIKNYEGSALSGTLAGFNANVANALAAMFIATGQDAAQIVESASAFIHADTNEKGDLIFGATFPSIEVAAVGGGTSFGTARDALNMLGCFGPGKKPGDNAKKLAEIMAAVATAQDLNLLAAQAREFELADSHMKLARGKK